MSSQTHDQLSLETDALYDPSYGWPGNEGSQYYQAYGSASSVPGHFGSADIPTGYSVPTASTSSLPDLDTQSTTSSQSSAGPRRIENLEDALAQYNIPQKVEQSRARAQGRGKSKRDQVGKRVFFFCWTHCSRNDSNDQVHTLYKPARST